MEVISTEVMQDTNLSHEDDDSTSAAAVGIGEGSVAEVKAENPGMDLQSEGLAIHTCSPDITYRSCICFMVS